MKYMMRVSKLIEANQPMHQELCSHQLMMDAVKIYAKHFRSRHQELMDEMDQKEAFEIAQAEIEHRLSLGVFPLAAAIAYVRAHSPTA